MASASFCLGHLPCSNLSSSPLPSPPPFRASGNSPQHYSSSIHTTLVHIQNSGVIACLRASSAEQAMTAATAALRGGISVLEIVISTPGVFEVLKQLVLEYPTKTLGVGTVLNPEDASNAKDAGAKFFMSPVFMKEIMDVVDGGEILYIPGAMTPTEILSAYNAGAKIVKVYPVSALGGIHYISAIMKPFSHIPMVASQGITRDSVGDYITAGASSVLLSDAIFDKRAMAESKFDTIRQLAHLAALQGHEAVERKKGGEID